MRSTPAPPAFDSPDDHGAWYRILTRDNRRYDDLKSSLGKTDYHTMGACYGVLRAIAAAR